MREKGAARVYLDFLKKIYAEVKARGHVMMFWGDIVLTLLSRDAQALLQTLKGEGWIEQ